MSQMEIDRSESNQRVVCLLRLNADLLRLALVTSAGDRERAMKQPPAKSEQCLR